MSYNFSYSTIDDIYATAAEETGSVQEELHVLAADLEQSGVGYFNGTEYWYRQTNYGMEVISMDDYYSEKEDEEDDDE